MDSIGKIDTNKDGKVTPYEIKRFWTTSKGLNIHPDKHVIIQYIIEPTFKDGIKKMKTSKFLSSLSNPTEGHSMIMNVAKINQGRM